MSTATVTVHDLELSTDRFDAATAARIYQEHGCLVVRGLMQQWAAPLCRDILARTALAISLVDQATPNENGWCTPDGTLFIPAPKHFTRDKQVMVVSINYLNSAAFFHSALEPRVLDLAEAVLGPNVELFMNGQVLVKEPVGGHPKLLHQDGAYFEHRFQGPLAMLCYAVDTDLQNGALHVVPGSHRLGVLRHVDTESHLGLDLAEWPWERALPIVGQAGDAIFFHVLTIHGSQPNWSNAPRPVFIHRYRAANDFCVVGATNTRNRARAEEARAEARKDNQLGFMVRGVRAWAP
jgi:ectoine hydroxylase-related dioxygenase (phytanoyl-CoA dioxygenase family)